VPEWTVLRSDLGSTALSGNNVVSNDCGSGAQSFICRSAIESSNKRPVPFVLGQLVQSPQVWPFPRRRTVLHRCKAAIHWAGYELSANQQLCGLLVALAPMVQN